MDGACYQLSHVRLGPLVEGDRFAPKRSRNVSMWAGRVSHHARRVRQSHAADAARRSAGCRRRRSPPRVHFVRCVSIWPNTWMALNSPFSDETDAETSPYGTARSARLFRSPAGVYAIIYSSDEHGIYLLEPKIGKLHDSLGGAGSWLGFPKLDANHLKTEGIHWQVFEGGANAPVAGLHQKPDRCRATGESDCRSAAPLWRAHIADSAPPRARLCPAG
jgi:hypothetical protein